VEIVVNNGQAYVKDKIGDLQINIPVPEVYMLIGPDGMELSLNKLPNTVLVHFSYDEASDET